MSHVKQTTRLSVVIYFVPFLTRKKASKNLRGFSPLDIHNLKKHFFFSTKTKAITKGKVHTGAAEIFACFISITRLAKNANRATALTSTPGCVFITGNTGLWVQFPQSGIPYENAPLINHWEITDFPLIYFSMILGIKIGTWLSLTMHWLIIDLSWDYWMINADFLLIVKWYSLISHWIFKWCTHWFMSDFLWNLFGFFIDYLYWYLSDKFVII